MRSCRPIVLPVLLFVLLAAVPGAAPLLAAKPDPLTAAGQPGVAEAPPDPSSSTLWLPAVFSPHYGLTFYGISTVPGSNGSDAWLIGYDPVPRWDGQLLTEYWLFRWDGAQWKPQAGSAPWYYGDISMVSATDGWLIAKWPSIQSNPRLGHWDGSTWTKSFGPVCSMTNWSDVEMASATAGWVVGIGCRVTFWDGENGTVVDTGRTAYNAVSIVPGSGGMQAWAVGDAGMIAGGTPTTWNAALSPTNNTLWDVAMVAAASGWAVGDNGTILSYDGHDWSIYPSPTLKHLLSVAVVPGTAGHQAWAVGEDGVMLHWDGTTWLMPQSPTMYRLRGVAFSSATDGWAVGDERTALHYNGVTWMQAPVDW